MRNRVLQGLEGVAIQTIILWQTRVCRRGDGGSERDQKTLWWVLKVCGLRQGGGTAGGHQGHSEEDHESQKIVDEADCRPVHLKEREIVNCWDLSGSCLQEARVLRMPEKDRQDDQNTPKETLGIHPDRDPEPLQQRSHPRQMQNIQVAGVETVQSVLGDEGSRRRT